MLGDLNDYDAEVPEQAEEHATQTQVLALLKDFAPDSPGQELAKPSKTWAMDAGQI